MSECTHHFEHVKQTRPFTEREYMQCTKCGLQNQLGLFQTVDFSQPGTPVYASLNEPISMRDQPGYFYRGHAITDSTHAVYRIEMKDAGRPHAGKYLGLFTTEQIQNGEHRK